MIKDPLRKQVIISMNIVNSNRFMVLSNKHISNISRDLKNIKSDVMANFVQANHKRLVITTNKTTSILDLNTIKRYIRNVDAINSNNIMSLKLSQSKSYLKILGILYLIEDNNVPIFSNVVEILLQSIHIFNNVVLTLKPRVIKASPKLNIVVIWIDI